jgi:hypothetical protein
VPGSHPCRQDKNTLPPSGVGASCRRPAHEESLAGRITLRTRGKETADIARESRHQMDSRPILTDPLGTQSTDVQLGSLGGTVPAGLVRPLP